MESMMTSRLSGTDRSEPLWEWLCWSTLSHHMPPKLEQLWKCWLADATTEGAGSEGLTQKLEIWERAKLSSKISKIYTLVKRSTPLTSTLSSLPLSGAFLFIQAACLSYTLLLASTFLSSTGCINFCWSSTTGKRCLSTKIYHSTPFSTSNLVFSSIFWWALSFYRTSRSCQPSFLTELQKLRVSLSMSKKTKRH